MNTTRSGLLALSALLPLVLIACQKKETQKQKPPAAIAGWVARDTLVPKSIEGVGTLVPDAQVDLKSEIAGRIVAVGFKEGQAVRKGQLLIKIADAEYRAARDKAQASLAYQKQTLSRRKQQLAIQAVSQQDVDAAVQAVASAQADLDLAEAQLAKTALRSPFDGKVGITSAAVGQYLSAGQLLAQLAKVRPMRVEFQVPSDQVPLVHLGMPLRFAVWGSKDMRAAKIYAADPAVDSVSRSLKIRALWNGSEEGLVAGSSVQVSIPLGSARSILMPPQGLGADARGPSALVLRGGKAVQMPVKVGRRTETAVEIVSGIAVGDTVLCNGSVPVKAGAAIKPSRYL